MHVLLLNCSMAKWQEKEVALFGKLSELMNLNLHYVVQRIALRRQN